MAVRSQLSYSQAELGPEVSEVDDQHGVVQPGGEDVVVVCVVLGVGLELLVPGAGHHQLAVLGHHQGQPGQLRTVRVCRDLNILQVTSCHDNHINQHKVYTMPLKGKCLKISKIPFNSLTSLT